MNKEDRTNIMIRDKNSVNSSVTELIIPKLAETIDISEA